MCVLTCRWHTLWSSSSAALLPSPASPPVDLYLSSAAAALPEKIQRLASMYLPCPEHSTTSKGLHQWTNALEKIPTVNEPWANVVVKLLLTIYYWSVLINRSSKLQLISLRKKTKQNDHRLVLILYKRSFNFTMWKMVNFVLTFYVYKSSFCSFLENV